MRERGEDPEPFWNRVKDVVIKTILCGHKKIDTMVKEDVGSFYNNYNILGFDIFIDTDYRWCFIDPSLTHLIHRNQGAPS